MKRWHLTHSEAPELVEIGHGHIFLADTYPGCTDLDCTEEHVAVVPWEMYLGIIEDARTVRRIRKLIAQHAPILKKLADS